MVVCPCMISVMKRMNLNVHHSNLLMFKPIYRASSMYIEETFEHQFITIMKC